jgi:hypothetical protein
MLGMVWFAYELCSETGNGKEIFFKLVVLLLLFCFWAVLPANCV